MRRPFHHPVGTPEGTRLAGGRRLPWPLRAWVSLAARDERGRRVAARLAARFLKPDEIYRTPRGFLLRIDAEDPIFQPAMAAGVFDPVVDAVIRTYVRPSSVAVDAGAHIGYFTMQMARAVGPEGSVAAFECDPRLLPRLRDHVALNGLDWVSVNEQALWSITGKELVLQLAEIPGWSFLERGMWEPTGTSRVSTVSLDDYLSARALRPERVSFIKLDIEASEIEALEGMQRVLAGTGAAVLIELQRWAMLVDESRRDRILGLMEAHGYRPFSPSLDRRGALSLSPGAEPPQGEDVLFLKRPSSQQ